MSGGLWETLPTTIGATLAFAALWAWTRRPDRLSAAVFWGLLLTLCFVLLHFSVKFQNLVITKDIFAQVAAFTLTLLWLSHLHRKSGFVLAPDPLAIPVFMFLAVSILSAYLAPQWAWYYSLEEIARFAALVLIYFLTVRFFNTFRRWMAGVYALLACVVITSVYALLQIYGYDFTPWGFTVNVSTFGNKDFFASFLTYTFPIALALAVGSANLFDRCLHLTIAGLALYHIIQGQTRGAWLALLVLAALVVLYESTLGKLRQSLGSIRKIALILAAAGVLAVGSFQLVPKQHRDTFKSIFQTHSGTNLIRVYIWWTSYKMWEDNPVFGQGLGSYQLTYPYFRPDRYNRIGMSHNTRHAHSEELEILSEQGILGFSVWLAVMVAFFYLGARRLKTIEHTGHRYLFFGILCGLFTGLVHDSINVNLRWTSSAVPFWFLMALVSRFSVGFDPPPDRKVPRRADDRSTDAAAFSPAAIALAAPLAAVFAFMFVLEWRTLRADWYLKVAEQTVERDTTQLQGIEATRLTLQEIPYDHSAYYKGAYGYLRQNKIEEAQEYYDRLMILAPNYAQMHQNTAMIAYREFGRKKHPKYLHQSILEFEWTTILENSVDNHFKLMQLHSQHRSDWGRTAYHAKFLYWNVLEDATHNLRLYYTNLWNDPTMPAGRRGHFYDVYMKPVEEPMRTYWLFKTDMLQKTGRSPEELRYALKLANRFQSRRTDLVSLAVSAFLSSADNSTRSLMYLLSVVDRLDAEDAPPTLFREVREAMESKFGKSPADPLASYVLGVLSHRLGDRDAARSLFQAATRGPETPRFILDGIRTYGI